MAFLRSIYNLDFRNLVKKPDICMKDDLSRKMDLVLVDSSYSLREDQNDDYVDYVVFGSSDMKNMAKVLGILMKLESMHTCCAPLHNSSSGNSLFLPKRGKYKALFGRFSESQMPRARRTTA